MILVVGLGNPGLQYTFTRHNVGFICADVIAHYLGFPEFCSRFSSLVSKRMIDREYVLIQKPQTFMNLSGIAVQKVVSFYKVLIDEIFVVHDDINLSPFDIRIKKSGSSGGHNGLKNIDDAIGQDYWRIRIGVGRPMNKNEVSDYVVSKFYADELQLIQQVCEKIAEHFCNIVFSSNKADAIQKFLIDVRQPC